LVDSVSLIPSWFDDSLNLVERWNPALFASQGYFVIAVNPTGSTGYGQEFTDRIGGEWGGREMRAMVRSIDADGTQDHSRTLWRVIKLL